MDRPSPTTNQEKTIELMNEYQNLHTHTSYCDGKQTAEEMIIAAIQKGGGSIGFAEHSYVSFIDKKYSMSPEDTALYINEVSALKEKYLNIIEVFLGLEMDCLTENAPEGMDYIIGSAHHAQRDGIYVAVDGPVERLERANRELFGGDYLAIAESYYAMLADVAEKTGADIIGHFDLVTKYNSGGKMFDETHPRYIKAALGAMDRILERCKIFEVNTGAMFRVGKSEQYPSQFILRELHKRGGEVTLSSDSHSADSLYYKFNEMWELISFCGFKYIKRLTKDGFIDQEL